MVKYDVRYSTFRVKSQSPWERASSQGDGLAPKMKCRRCLKNSWASHQVLTDAFGRNSGDSGARGHREFLIEEELSLPCPLLMRPFYIMPTITGLTLVGWCLAILPWSRHWLTQRCPLLSSQFLSMISVHELGVLLRWCLPWQPWTESHRSLVT